VVAVVLGTSGWVSIAQEADPDGRVVVAEFASASPLLEGSDIKVHGVKVGTISAIQLGSDNHALVSMKLDGAAFPLHRDATAKIRAVSLLGERYVDLERGSASAPELGRNARIPVKQTAQNTDLDQVLSTIDEPTGDSLAELIGALGDGLDGNGHNADVVIKALEPAMKDTDGLAKVLRGQNDLLNSLVTKLAPVTAALAADNGKTLDQLVGSATSLTEATANRQAELEKTLTALPGTLSDARSVLGDLAGTARQTAPTLQAIRPVTDNLAAISGELEKFSDAADPALASAEPVLDKAKALLDAARPVADQLRQASPGIKSASASLEPIVSKLTDNFGNVLNFLRYWALTTNGYDGISHYFRAHVTFDASIAAGNLLGPGVPALSQPPPENGQTQPQGGAAGVLDEILGLQGGQPTGLLAAPGSSDGSATGLDQQQESDVLGFLLGGGR
jgi:phospholipid/cholesterol/gamma-HCH transport system substrate-binding protein